MSATAITENPGRVAQFGPAFWRAVRAEVWGDRLIHGLVLAYAIGAGVLALALGETEKLVYLEYFPVWLKALAGISLVILIIVEIAPSVRADPSAPLARVRARLPDLLNPRVAAALVLLADVILLKGTFTSVKNMLPDMTGFRWDGAFAAADAWFAGGADPWTRLQPILGHHLVTRAIQMVYAVGWMLAVCSIPTLVGASRRAAPVRARFFLTYIFCWVMMGNVMAGVFMSAGPAFFSEATGDAARFAAQMDYLSFSHGMANSSFDYQHTLWQLHLLDRVELGTGISAFPSLHVAMATLFFLTGLKINRLAACVSGAFLAIIMAGSVHLAWHYAVDGLASMVLVTMVWFAIAGAERLRAPRTAAV